MAWHAPRWTVTTKCSAKMKWTSSVVVPLSDAPCTTM